MGGRYPHLVMRPGHAPARQQRLRFAALHSSLHFSRRFRANTLTGRQQRAGRQCLTENRDARLSFWII
jgi:hypothetical protein